MVGDSGSDLGRDMESNGFVAGSQKRAKELVCSLDIGQFRRYTTDSLFEVVSEENMKGFMEFVREQGVVGLAVGFILGGSVSKVVSSLVNDIINPVLGMGLAKVGGLKGAYLMVGEAKIMWGSFVSVAIDFLVIAAVVYFGVKGLGLDKLDRKK